MTAQVIDLQNLQLDPQIGIEPAAPRVDDTDCLLCGASIAGVHCKILCKSRGFMRDYSDP